MSGVQTQPLSSQVDQPLPQLLNLVAQLGRCLELQVARQLEHLLFHLADALGDFAG
ncbi:hypothetical protein D3C76_1863120 [compost metagenome]